MESQPNPGARSHGGAPRYRRGTSTSKAPRNAGTAAVAATAAEPAQAAMAVVSRCANHALSQQIEHAYAAAERARDYATAAAAIAEREYPPGAARDALLAALYEHKANSERMMGAVLRFGREHGHLAFAFRYAVDTLASDGARKRTKLPAAESRRATVRRRRGATPSRRAGSQSS
jgi:hypothetical protein